mgnify:CR=1 FL=1
MMLPPNDSSRMHLPETIDWQRGLLERIGFQNSISFTQIRGFGNHSDSGSSSGQKILRGLKSKFLFDHHCCFLGFVWFITLERGSIPTNEFENNLPIYSD